MNATSILPEKTLIFTVDRECLSSEENEARRFLVQRIMEMHEHDYTMFQTSKGPIFFVAENHGGAFGDTVAISLGKAFQIFKVVAKTWGSLYYYQLGKHPKCRLIKGYTAEAAIHALTKSNKIIISEVPKEELPRKRKRTRTRYTNGVRLECGKDTIAMWLHSDVIVNREVYNQYQYEIAKKIIATGSDFDKAKPIWANY